MISRTNYDKIFAPWRDRAECHKRVTSGEVDEWAFTDEENPDYLRAISACGVCPVRDQCLRDAVQDPEAQGVRAGYYFDLGVVSRSDHAKIYRETGVEVPTNRVDRAFLDFSL